MQIPVRVDDGYPLSAPSLDAVVLHLPMRGDGDHCQYCYADHLQW